MKYETMRAIREQVGCYEDEFGNRPCDNGAVCDRCMRSVEPPLSYEEFMTLALNQYNEGGDSVYECWEKSQFEEYVKEWGPMTVAGAVSLFKMYKSMECER